MHEQHLSQLASCPAEEPVPREILLVLPVSEIEHANLGKKNLVDLEYKELDFPILDYIFQADAPPLKRIKTFYFWNFGNYSFRKSLGPIFGVCSTDV